MTNSRNEAEPVSPAIRQNESKWRKRVSWLLDAATLVVFVLVGALCIVSFIPPRSISGQLTLSGAVVIGLLTAMISIFLWKERARLWYLRAACLGIVLVRGLNTSLDFASHDLNAALLLAAGTVVVVGIGMGAITKKLGTLLGALLITSGILFPFEFLILAAWARTQSPTSTVAQAIEIGALSLGLPCLLPIGMYWYGSLLADEKVLESGPKLRASFWI